MSNVKPDAVEYDRERVTEQETAALIRRSDREHLLELGFGPSGAWLQPVSANDWARAALKEMRSE